MRAKVLENEYAARTVLSARCQARCQLPIWQRLPYKAAPHQIASHKTARKCISTLPPMHKYM